MCAFCFSKDQDDCVTPADGVEDVNECRLGTKVPNDTDQDLTRERVAGGDDPESSGVEKEEEW